MLFTLNPTSNSFAQQAFKHIFIVLPQYSCFVNNFINLTCYLLTAGKEFLCIDQNRE